MKKIINILLLFISSWTLGQNAVTNTGTISFSGTVTIGTSAFGFNRDNIYEICPGGTWIGPTTDGAAALPIAGYCTLRATTPSNGTIRTVVAGSYSSLVSAISASSCGDVIVIPAAVAGIQQVYAGTQILPTQNNCDSAHYITIRTDQLASLPPEGTRISPCYANVASLPGRYPFNCPSGGAAPLMPKLVLTPVSGKALFDLGINNVGYFRFIGLEISVDCTQTGNYDQLLHIGSALGHNILDQVWLTGCELPNAPAIGGAPSQVQCGVQINGSYQAIIDSYINDFYTTSVSSSIDSQGICGGNGNTTETVLKIVNNYIEGAGENILLGGGAATINPSDIEIRLNHFFKPLQWRCNPLGCPAGGHIIIKNPFEIKNGIRILFEGNINENNWNGPKAATQSDQDGAALLLTPKSLNGTCPNCIVTDVTIRYGMTTHTANGFEIAAALADSGAASLGMARVSIHDMILDDINPAMWLGGAGCAPAGNATELLVDPGIPPTGWLAAITLAHNTFIINPAGGLNCSGAMSFTQHPSTPVDYKNLIYQNNLGAAPVWYSKTPGGFAYIGATATLNAIDAAATWCMQGNLFTTGNWSGELTNNPYPAPGDNPTGGACHNGTPNNVVGPYTTLGFVNFNGGNGGNYQLAPSSPYINTASDGTNPGANIASVNAMLIGVQ